MIELVLQKPSGALIQTEASEVVLPTMDGEITILPGHAELYTALVEGSVVTRNAGEDKSYSIGGGLGWVEAGHVRLLVV
jgi:F-type H+-transporting ATPase subunit epsilon